MCGDFNIFVLLLHLFSSSANRLITCPTLGIETSSSVPTLLLSPSLEHPLCGSLKNKIVVSLMRSLKCPFLLTLCDAVEGVILHFVGSGVGVVVASIAVVAATMGMIQTQSQSLHQYIYFLSINCPENTRHISWICVNFCSSHMML